MDDPLDSDLPGILGQPAPELGVRRWVDASGAPIADYGLARMGEGYKLVFCFQHNCPGCHTHGFPALAALVQALRGSPNVRIAAVQTVFEEWEHNTYEHMLANQRRYALPIVFGHDAGEAGDGRFSEMMRRYRSGGTPWFVLIDPSGRVVHNHFSIDVGRTVAFLREAAVSAPVARPPGGFDWGEVIRRANHGNAPAPRRVERSDAEWRALLTPDQYHVAREKGTERAHSSAMCGLFEPGRYHCVCCDTPLFDASGKFASRSGWPSFTRPIDDAVVAYYRDDSHGMRRIETACAVCDAHLGHVFPDGPEPTGLRFCINALALVKR